MEGTRTAYILILAAMCLTFVSMSLDLKNHKKDRHVMVILLVSVAVMIVTLFKLTFIVDAK